VKYLVYKNNGKEFILVFPGDSSERQHKQIAEALNLTDIISAGFFLEIGTRKVFTGESMSLNIKSRGHADRDLYIEQCRH
jgi:GGDEF domain-containing protein